MAYNDDVIVINIQERGFKDILEKVKTLNSLLNKPWAVAKGLKNNMGLSRTSELIEKTGKAYDQMWASINKEIDTTYDNFQKKQIKYDADKEKKIAAERVKAQRQLEQAVIKTNRSYLQAGLSVMFFGMQMQRAFQSIATQSLTTFNKLNADTEDANNATNRLNASMEGLSYVIGDAINTALEGMEGFLTNILNVAMDVINNNQDWIGWAIIIGVIVGGLMAMVGQFGLLFIGLAALSGTKIGGFLGLGAAAKTATDAGSKGILGMIGYAVGLIAVWGVIIGLFTGQEWGRKLLLNFIKIIGNIVIFFIWLGQKITDILIKAFYYIAKAIFSIFDWIGVGIINAIVGVINWMLGAIESAINKIVKSSLFQKFAEFMGWNISGVSLGRLGYQQQTSIKDRMSGIVDEFIDSVSKGPNMEDLKRVQNIFGTGLENTLGVGLERLFGASEKQEDAADKNLRAAEINAQSAAIWSSLLSSMPTSGGGVVNSTYNNGQLNYGWSSVVSGATT